MLKWLIALAVAVQSGATFAQGASVGLVNLVSGKVTYSPVGGAVAKELTGFWRLAEGDRVDLAAGAQVRVAFLEANRQERWVGPASFRVRKDGGEPISGKAAETATLPGGVQQRIARIPDLVQLAKLGGIQVRGKITPAQQASLEQQMAVREARATYERMRKDAAADDIAPEMYLYSALHEYLLYEDMKAVAQEMLRRQPGNGDVKALAEWLRTRVGRQK